MSGVRDIGHVTHSVAASWKTNIETAYIGPIMSLFTTQSVLYVICMLPFHSWLCIPGFASFFVLRSFKLIRMYGKNTFFLL